MKFFVSKDIKSIYISPPKDLKKISLNEIYIATKGTLKRISDKILILKDSQFKQLNLKLPEEFSIKKIKEHKADSIKILIVNGFGNGYGDMLVGSVALENLYNFLKKKYQNVFIDFLVWGEYLGRYYEVFKLNPYVNKIYPVINLEKYLEYNFYIDNQGFVNDKDFEEITFIDFFIKRVGLNPKEHWIDKNLKLYPNPKVVEEAKKLKENLNLPDKPTILINFFATPLRHFPEFKWKEIIDKFKNEYNIILISYMNYQEKLRKFVSSLNYDNIYDLSEISSKGFDYLIAITKEIPDVVLTPDTSLTHVCGGLNKPCVTVYFSIPPEIRTTYYKTVVPYSPEFLRDSKFWKKSKLKNEEQKDIEKDKEFLELWNKINISEIKNLVDETLKEKKLLKPNIPEKIYLNVGKTPKILVYTNRNSFNFKLINSVFPLIFPENVYTKISDLIPVEFNSLSKYDLVVIGTGEVLPKTVFKQPDFQDFFYGAKKSIGIFDIPSDSFDKTVRETVKSLDYWFVNSKLTVKKTDFKNAKYLGLWQILAFPFTDWEVDGKVKVSKDLGITNELLINKIQKYRKVYAEQLYPLMAALNSAEFISYEDKLNENIKDILFDIFGRQFVPNKEFKVDKEKVLNYRKEIMNNIRNLKQKIEELI
jgi:hypothetical protein